MVHFCQKASQIREVGNRNPEHCDSIAFCFTKLCWWVLLGIVISWNILQLCAKGGENQQNRFIQQQPLSQQLHPLPQLQQQQAQISSRTGGKWRKKALVIFVFGGVILSIWLYLYLSADIALRRKETLTSMCDERARMLQDQFNVSMNHVHALAVLISTFHHGKQPSAIDQVQLQLSSTSTFIIYIFHFLVVCSMVIIVNCSYIKSDISFFFPPFILAPLHLFGGSRRWTLLFIRFKNSY